MIKQNDDGTVDLVIADMQALTDVNAWGFQVHDLAKRKGWWEPGKDSVSDKVVMMHTELSEMIDEYRNGHRMTEVYFKNDKHGQAKPEGVPIEAADLAIRLFDFCFRHKIDLNAAIAIKHEFNSGRPYLHGGKKL